jgi:hypothetical protein
MTFFCSTGRANINNYITTILTTLLIRCTPIDVTQVVTNMTSSSVGRLRLRELCSHKGSILSICGGEK